MKDHSLANWMERNNKFRVISDVEIRYRNKLQGTISQLKNKNKNKNKQKPDPIMIH